jgi:D-glycero-D-manno-heptose 1,7-bisphosphate phosphatase
MLLQASLELGLDPSRSWMVGDMISDALAGQDAGCQGSLLVRTGKALGHHEAIGGVESVAPYPIVDDLSAAVESILGSADVSSTIRCSAPRMSDGR